MSVSVSVEMLPLCDENPTTKKPIVTWLLIGLCLVTFAAPYLDGNSNEVVQFTSAENDLEVGGDARFYLRWAAVPCEITQRRPLTVTEVAETSFADDQTEVCNRAPNEPALFPQKHVLAAIVASLFVHSGIVHLGINILFLWVFGNNVEDRLGHIPFLIFYLTAGIAGTIAHVAAQPSSTIAIIGASGAVAGVMGSYLVWYPDAPIRTLLFLVLVDIRARWFLLAWFVVQFLTSTGPGGWVTHVAGFGFGVIAGRLVRKFQPRLRLLPGQMLQAWDFTGGAGHGPYPHLDEVWIEPHSDHYE